MLDCQENVIILLTSILSCVPGALLLPSTQLFIGWSRSRSFPVAFTDVTWHIKCLMETTALLNEVAHPGFFIKIFMCKSKIPRVSGWFGLKSPSWAAWGHGANTEFGLKSSLSKLNHPLDQHHAAFYRLWLTFVRDGMWHQ